MISRNYPLDSGPFEVVPRGERVRVVGAQHPVGVGQGPVEQRDRLVQPARRLVGAREVVPRDERVRVVGTQHPLPVGQGPFVEGDGLVQPAGRARRRPQGCCGR